MKKFNYFSIFKENVLTYLEISVVHKEVKYLMDINSLMRFSANRPNPVQISFTCGKEKPKEYASLDTKTNCLHFATQTINTTLHFLAKIASFK